MKTCRICSSPRITHRKDFGSYPVSHHFRPANLVNHKQSEVRLSLIQCTECSTIQLAEAPALESMRFNFDWLRQGEPEDHLDEVVQSLLDVKEASADWEVCGLSYKDTSLVERLSARGFCKSRTLEYSYSLDGVDQSRNVVYIQNAMNKRFPEDVYGTGKGREF